MKQMMSLGGFVFSLSEGTPYAGLQRSSDGGWVNVEHNDKRSMSQHTGKKADTMTINGAWFRAQGMQNMDMLRFLQAIAVPLVLIDGYGMNLGLWVIKRLQEKQDRIIDDGTALVVDFTIELEEYVSE